MPIYSPGMPVTRGGRLRRAVAACLAAVMAALLAFCAPAFAPSPALAESTGTVAAGQQLSEGSAVDDEHGVGINDFERRNKGREDKSGLGYVYQVNDESAFVVLVVDNEILLMVPQDVADEVGFQKDDEGYVKAFLAMVGDLDEAASKGGTLVKDISGAVTVCVGQDEVEFGNVKVTRNVSIGEGDKARLYVTLNRTDGKANNEGAVLCDYGHIVTTDAVVTEAIPTWWENLCSFLSTIDYRPLWVSLKTSAVALVIVFILGLLAAWKSLGVKSRWQGIVDTVFTIPMVLPPTVCGFLLLLLFGNALPTGQWLMAHGIKLVFSWPATVIAATVVAFPLMYRTARGAFEALDANMLDAARTLGWSERRIFYTLMIPNAWPSIAAGTVLAFARAMGEFGATLFCAGNYAGVTQTMPIAIYFQWMGGNTDVAIFWVVVVIFISFLVILFINVYTAHSQRYRKGGLTRAELKMLKRQGKLAGDEQAGVDDQSFSGIHAEDAESLFERVSSDSHGKAGD